MTLQYKHKYTWHKWGRFLNILLMLSLSACSDYERSIYDPNSPNYIGDRYVPIEIQTIDKILESGETPDSVKVQATVVATHTRGLLLSDETGYILVNIEDESGNTRQAAPDDATRNAGSYTEGDVVTVEGVVTSDAGLLQFPSTSKTQKVGSAEVVHPEPEAWNGAAFYNYFDNISIRYVKYTGVLSKEGNDYIVTVLDSAITAVGQITYPASDLVDANDEGEEVQVIGYAIGYTDDKYVRTMVTSIKVVGKSEEEPKEEPSFSTVLYMIGNDFGAWDWASDGVVEMTPVHSHPGHFWAIRHMTTATEFKFCAFREWNGDFTGLGNDSGYIGLGNCMVEADSIYMIYVDFEGNRVIVEPANVYGIGECFGGWDVAMDKSKFVAVGTTLVSPTIVVDGNIRMYAAAPAAVIGVDWWQMEFNLFDGKIVYRGAGGDQEAVPATAGQKITLDFNAGTEAINGSAGDNEPMIDETAVAEAVDLGLSVKWASWNVGATAPEEYGGYYAWGETEVKDNYDWRTYKWCNGTSNSITKYCTDSDYGAVDNKIVLDPEDDVAHVKWGGVWRMPTLDEIKELTDKCSWGWTSQNNVNGYNVTGPNGNSIFLPAAGCLDGWEVGGRGSDGYYGSGMMNEYSNRIAYYLGFGSDYLEYYYGIRYFGLSVRPVQGEVVGDEEQEEAILETFINVSINNGYPKDEDWGGDDDESAEPEIDADDYLEDENWGGGADESTDPEIDADDYPEDENWGDGNDESTDPEIDADDYPEDENWGGGADESTDPKIDADDYPEDENWGGGDEEFAEPEIDADDYPEDENWGSGDDESTDSDIDIEDYSSEEDWNDSGNESANSEIQINGYADDEDWSNQ